MLKKQKQAPLGAEQSLDIQQSRCPKYAGIKSAFFFFFFPLAILHQEGNNDCTTPNHHFVSVNFFLRWPSAEQTSAKMLRGRRRGKNRAFVCSPLEAAFHRQAIELNQVKSSKNHSVAKHTYGNGQLRKDLLACVISHLISRVQLQTPDY